MTPIVTRAPQQTHDALIAYSNAATTATSITATSTDGDNVASNMFNGFTFDGWKADAAGTQHVQINFTAPVTVDYFAYYNTDASENGATIKFQYSSGGGFVDAVSILPIDNSPQLSTFAPVSATAFRVVIENATSATMISVASFGEFLPIPFGLENSFNSPHNSQQYSNITNASETGNFIGRSVRKQSSDFTVSTRLLQYDWFIQNWRPFIRHAERRPFFFKWSNSTYTDEAVYCWTVEKIQTPVFTDEHFMSFSLDLKGLVT